MVWKSLFKTARIFVWAVFKIVYVIEFFKRKR